MVGKHKHTNGVRGRQAAIFASAISMLLGFLLIVETMPNVVVHSTGRVSQKDFLWPGLWLTLASIAIMIVIAYTYWRWIGFWP